MDSNGASRSAILPPSAVQFPNVLILDRADADRHALAITLQREGFTVDATSDGQEALALLEPFDPMLVLMEMSLPGMRGLDVCRAIRERTHAPVVFLTTRDSEIDVVLGL